jgi:hypothetical protein
VPPTSPPEYTCTTTLVPSPTAIPATPLKVGLGFSEELPFAGLVRMIAGAVASIVQLKLVAALSLPATSRALTSKLWAPSVRLE